MSGSRSTSITTSSEIESSHLLPNFFDSDSSDIEAAPAAENASEKKYSKTVFYTILGLTSAAVGLEMGYEAFTFEYDYKVVDSVFPKYSLAAATTLTVLGAGADFLLVNPKAEAKMLAENFPNGFLSGLYHGVKARFTEIPFKSFTKYPVINGIVTFALPTVGMLVNFNLGAYGDYEAIQPWLKDHAPGLVYPAMGLVCLLGTTYYTIATAKDNYDGIDALLNQGHARLDHPDTEGGPQEAQKTLRGHIADGNLASVMQMTLEVVSSNILSRPIGFGFLAGRILEQNTDSDDSAIAAAQLIGVLSTIVAAYPARYMSSYGKFFGTKEQRLDLVTKEERDQAYADKYSGKPWALLTAEMKRLLHPLGMAEAVLSGYAGYSFGKAANEWVGIAGLSQQDNQSENVSSNYALYYLLPALSALVFSAAVYFGMYRNAYLRRELNQHALATKSASLATDINSDESVAQPQTDSRSVMINSLAAMFVVSNAISRGLSGEFSTMDNRVLQRMVPNKTDLAVLGAAYNAITLINFADYYYGKVKNTMHSLRGASLFSSCQRKPKNDVDETTPLLVDRERSVNTV